MNAQYRAHLPVWIFIGGLSCFPWLIVWVNSWRGIDITAFLIAITVSGLAFAWLLSFRIVLTPTEVHFRSLFRGRQSIRHDQIQRVRLAWEFHHRTRGPMRLIIEPRAGTGVRELNINAKVFAKAAIDAVLELGARVAEVDDGGLRDGVVMRTVKELKSSRKR